MSEAPTSIIEETTEQQEISEQSKQLFQDCQKLLADHGQRKKVELPSGKFMTMIGRVLGTVPPEVKVIETTIIDANNINQQMQMINKERQIDFVLGDPNLGRLILTPEHSWIQLPKTSDIDGAKNPQTKQAQLADIQRYQKAFDLAKAQFAPKP